MALRNLERIKSTFVLVPPLGEITYNVNPNEIGKFLREPQVQANPAGSVTIISVRDQIVVRLGPRVEFEDQSESGGRLAEVVHSLLKLLALSEARAYGWNFELAFDAPGDEPAAQFLQETFINQKALKERLQAPGLGASFQIFFEQSSARCRLLLEPRNQDLNAPRFHSSINYHYELSPEQGLPELDDLRIMYSGLWGTYQELLDRMVRP
jgi:hypothetical protein